MTTRLLPILAALLLAPTAAAVTEKLVFQANSSPPGFGFDVADGPSDDSCPAPYGHERCILWQTDAFHNKYLATSLPNGKHAYRVHFWIYAAADNSQSKFRAVFSLVPGLATEAMEGNGRDTGAFAESLQAVFAENSVGWDIELVQTVNGAYTVLASTSDGRPSTGWEGFDFQVNTDTGSVSLVNDLGNTVLQASFSKDRGRAINSQWYRETGGGIARETMWQRIQDSTQIYDLDRRAPIIADVRQTPRLVAANQAVWISANITDDWGQAAAVVHQWVNGAPAGDVTMQNTGIHYQAQLAGQPNGAEVRYQIEATAVSGLKTVSDTYRFQVGSTTGPDNLGGGTGSPGSEVGLLAAGIFVVLVGSGFALTFLDQAGKKPGQAPRAHLYSLVGIVAGIFWLAYIYNQDAINRFLARGDALPLLIILGTVVALPFLMGKRRPTP